VADRGEVFQGAKNVNQQCFAFDTPAKLSRRSDPITSQKSAAETESKLGRLYQEFLEVLSQMVAPATANEIDRACRKRFGGVEQSHRKRAAWLRKNGFIEECGERACSITGSTAMTFRVKEQS